MAGLRAGAATADITPHDFPGIRLGGFGFNRRATGILHPLEASALYLVDDRTGEEVALVTVDSVGLPHPWVERIRDHVRRVDPARVLVCATHSHAAPDSLGYWGRSILWAIPVTSGVEPVYMDRLARAVAGAVDAAKDAARAAKLRAARFEIEPGLFTNHRTQGMRDDAGDVLCVDGEDGAPVATLVNFAGHPEGLWEKNRRVSPDYPHHVRAVLRERGLGTPLFFNGALGAMLTPDIPVKSSTDVREREIERVGRALGEAAAAAARSAPALDATPLTVVSRPLYLPIANWRFKFAMRMGIFVRAVTNGALRTEMNLVRLGGASLLTVPGEASPELGVRFRQVLGGGPSFLFCLGCDELGYLLLPEQFADRHYAYEQTMSVHRDAATHLLETAQGLVGGDAPPDATHAPKGTA